MNRLFPIFRINGILLTLFSLSMLPPIGVALWYGERITPFVESFAYTLGAGLILWLVFRFHKREPKPRDGFLIVFLFWFILSVFGALPLMIAIHPHNNFTDAVFETVSGLTTTGASVIQHLDMLPRSILYYRQQLQFLGGMGIVILAIAILPMLGIGGMQLYRAETPGPVKDSKLTPRIKETAKALWYIYVGLNIACAVAFWLAGMHPLDAIGESFGTISTGGFSMHGTSFAYYHSQLINGICIVFMILGGTNFALHFLAIQQRSFFGYLRDAEFKFYLLILLVVSLISTAVLMTHHYYHSLFTAFMESAFNVVSMMTTTGFVADHFAFWPTFVPVLIMLVALIGGCAASTSGGAKVIRILLMFKQCRREIHKLVHPKSVESIKFGDQILPDSVVEAMWGFLAAYVSLFIILLLVLLGTGLDLTTSFGALGSAFANAGAGIGKIAYTYANLSIVSKWTLIFAMLAGRLEIFTILILFSPTYWKR